LDESNMFKLDVIGNWPWTIVSSNLSALDI